MSNAIASVVNWVWSLPRRAFHAVFSTPSGMRTISKIFSTLLTIPMMALMASSLQVDFPGGWMISNAWAVVWIVLSIVAMALASRRARLLELSKRKVMLDEVVAKAADGTDRQ